MHGMLVFLNIVCGVTIFGGFAIFAGLFAGESLVHPSNLDDSPGIQKFGSGLIFAMIISLIYFAVQLIVHG